MRFANNNLIASSFVTAVAMLFAGSAEAQHSDIEFGYDGGKIDIEFGPEGRVFEGEFDVSGLFEQQTSDPGFASEVAEGLGVNPGDIIDYSILGPLTYHDGANFAPVPTGANIILSDNPSGTLAVDASTMGPVSGPGAIGQADSGGDIHSHIDFELDPPSLDVAEYGAYGLLMELTTDATGIGNSDPYYVVFNFGLDETTFEGAVGAFSAQVPEPAGMALAGMAVIAMMSRRCRRD